MSSFPSDDAAAELGWFSHWFGEEYLQLYPHRDEREARSAVELVLRHAELPSDARVLDLACGGGRHLRELQERGVRAIGLDLSPFLLRHAKLSGALLIRADMRSLPVATGSCHLVTNFFTSFGYFADPADDLRVLEEVNRVLRSGGFFVFDFLNADRVRASLPATDERVEGDRSVRQVRNIVDGGRTVEKRIEILGPNDPMPHIYYERVRLYSPDELGALLAEVDLQVVDRFGSYGGAPISPSAPRVILIGRAV